MTQAELFTRACTALWGGHWRAQAAVELQLNERTIRRIQAGDADIPPGVWHELRGMMQRRSIELRYLEEQLLRVLLGP